MRNGRGLAATVGILLVLSPSGSLVASSATSGSIVVGATVRSRTTVERLDLPHALVVREDDAKRGYVNVIDGGGWTVRSNTRSYLVTVEISGPLPIVVAEVSGFGAPRSLASSGGEIPRHAAGPGRDSVTLAWRFHLADGVAPGTYDWPVRLDFTPRSRTRAP